MRIIKVLLHFFIYLASFITACCALAAVMDIRCESYKYDESSYGKYAMDSTFVITRSEPSMKLALSPPPPALQMTFKEPDKDAAKKIQQQGFGTYAVYFLDVNSARLDKGVIDQLKAVLPVFKSRNKGVNVTGYTCDIGSKDVNDHLAMKRAQAVAKYLEGQGVKVNQINGEGKSRYISSRKDINRRVEISLLSSLGDNTPRPDRLMKGNAHGR